MIIIKELTSNQKFEHRFLTKKVYFFKSWSFILPSKFIDTQAISTEHEIIF